MTRRPVDSAWYGFLIMCFVVVGLAGIFGTYASQIPLERGQREERRLDAEKAPPAAYARVRGQASDEAADIAGRARTLIIVITGGGAAMGCVLLGLCVSQSGGRAMTEVGFYHLTRSGAEQALPPLLGRTLAAGMRAVVLCGSAARVAALDSALWLCADPDWLPHGTAATGHPELQPIWITPMMENPNAAQFLFLVDCEALGDLGAFARVFDLFDGNDAAQREAARRRYAAARERGHLLTYWQQTERGWQKKA